MIVGVPKEVKNHEYRVAATPKGVRDVGRFWRGRIRATMSSALAVEGLVLEADLVVGAVLVPGAKAPHLVSAELSSRRRPGAVLVDISIDQGGCFETSHVTTHADPTYVVDGVAHYCVGNMPGAVPRTATYALTNVTLPHVLAIAKQASTGPSPLIPHWRSASTAGTAL